MRKTNIFICLIIFFATTVSVFSLEQDEETQNNKHFMHIAVNPIGMVFSIYNGEIGFGIINRLELGAQVTFINFENLTSMFSYSSDDYSNLLHLTGYIRLFPRENLSGFFITGRVTYLKFFGEYFYEEYDYNDLAIGVDLGWRWKWYFNERFGMLLQGYYGAERFILNSDEIMEYNDLPVIFVYGLQVGFFF